LLLLKGSPGSPYTRKMLSLLRYRHIPYRMILSGSAEAETLPKPRVALLPTFYVADENGRQQALTDSTPLLRRFETQFSGRSVIPPDPVLRFIDYLLEDYADEWLTKPMFHYRWHYPQDAEKAATILPYWHDISADPETLSQRQKAFAERQKGRLYVVGSSEVTCDIIENSYRRFLSLFETHLAGHSFLMGDRPGACDYAVFGQLTCLALFDPTPTAITLKHAPRVFAWVGLVEDLSGADCVETQWIERSRIADTYRELLTEIGRSYVPVMLANAQAALAGDKAFETRIDGALWRQPTFAYQLKCVQWIRAEYEKLEGDDRTAVQQVLDGTGCEKLLG